MPGYVILNYNVTDPDKFNEYRGVVRPTLQQYGAKLLVAAPTQNALEGEPLSTIVVIEFESVEKAQAWYNSPEYQEIIALRTESSEGWFVIADQFTPPQS